MNKNRRTGHVPGRDTQVSRLFAQGWTGWTGGWTGWLASEGGPSSRGPELDRWQWVKHLQHACTVVPLLIIVILSSSAGWRVHLIWYHFYASSDCWDLTIFHWFNPSPHNSVLHISWNYMSTRGYNSKRSELRWRSAACRSLGSALANQSRSKSSKSSKQKRSKHAHEATISAISTCDVVLAGRHHCSHNELCWKELVERVEQRVSFAFLRHEGLMCSSVVRMFGFKIAYGCLWILWIQTMEELLLVGFWTLLAYDGHPFFRSNLLNQTLWEFMKVLISFQMIFDGLALPSTWIGFQAQDTL